MSHGQEPQTQSDPLIDEVRAARRNLSEQFDHDLERLFEYLRHVQQEHPGRVVRRRKRLVPQVTEQEA